MNQLGKNLVIVLALVAAGFFAAWLRFRPYLGNEGRYTDGVQHYDVASGGEVRYAVWDAARGLPGDANGSEAERSPALSPDGRYMVFCVGEPGLGRDLYLAEMLDGRAIDPRPLSLLNTEADECAPCFSGGALYFASDRLGTAGGLDLYRARYDHGLFEEAERLTGEINSTSDDTDPAPAPGSEAILFASDRAGGALPNFDLFLARPVEVVLPEDVGGAGEEGDDPLVEAAEWSIEPLAVLNSGYDERDPAFTADGRTVFFASDRTASLGGFDLYRSSLGNDGWIPPVPLEGLNSEHSERGPMPTRDGFELLFSIETADDTADLFLARSRELFRTPGRPVGWRELLFLAVLVALALLAWMAKRWEQLEILYKCVLVSLLVHLLAMWAFQDVFPESGEYELRGDSNRILVRLVSNPTGPLASNTERGGQLEVEQQERTEVAERTDSEQAVATAAEAALARLERAAEEQIAVPERSGTSQQVRTTTAPPQVDVQDAAEQFQRMTGAQRELALEAARVEERTEQAEADAERDRRSEAVVAEAQPEAREQARAEQGAELPAAPAVAEASEERSAREDPSEVPVAQPRSTHERIAGAAPELSVQAAATGAAAPASDESAERADARADALAESVTVAPATELARADRGKSEPATDSERAASSEAREQRDVRELGPEVALADAADATPRISGGAQAFAVEAQSTSGRAERPVQGAARSVAQSETVAASERSPESWRQTRATQGADLPRAPGAGAASELPTQLDARSGVDVAQPTEALERIAGAAPELSLEASEAGRLGPRDDGPMAERGDTAAPDALAQGEQAAPAAGDLPRADQGREAPLEALAGRGATSELPTQSEATSRSSVALSDAEEQSFERIEGATQSLVVEAGATGATVPRTAEEAQHESGGAGQAMLSGAIPAQVQASRGTGSALPEAPGASGASELPTLREATGRVAVAQPSESVTRLTGAATELTLEAGTTSNGAIHAEVGEAERRPSDSRSTVQTDAARPVAAPASLARNRNGRDELGEPSPVARGTVDGPGALETRIAQLDLQDTEDTPTTGQGADGRLVKPGKLVVEATTFGEHSDGESGLAAERSVLVTRQGGQDAVGPSAAATLTRTRRDEDLAGPPVRGLGFEVVSSRSSSPRVDLQDARSGGDAPERHGPVSAQESGITRSLDDTLLALAPTELDRNRSASTSGPRRLDVDRSAPRTEAVPSFRPLEAQERKTLEDEGPARMTRWEQTPYQSRAGIQKQLALEEYGGSEETEAAVARGLAYLASKQKRNGYWGSADDRHEKYEHVAVGKTGLALLAFLGAAHTQDSNTEYSQVVERAIQFLIAVQDEETGHFGYTSSYSHGIATYALGECFALTGDERLRAPIEAAVAQILRRQQRSADSRIHGGWSYYYSDDHTFDRWPRASITAWQVMALESARLGGVKVPDRAFEDARGFLRKCWDQNRGAFRYSHDPARLGSSFDVLPGSTPASLFALSLLGDDVATSKFGKARAFVLDRAPSGYRYTTDDAFVHKAQGNLYFWYYGTLAMFRVDGVPWEMWNEAMKDTLLPSQDEDGSWRPISIYATDYAGDTQRDRTYSTAMCVLTLEVYYRYFTPLLKVE